tara:strand:- start:339 stop:605 length:267 start_codon:yes stop_codon:yes gene_type:complete
MEFSKNRLGAVGQKMFFNFEDGVTFDEARYSRDLLNDAMIQEERQKLETEDGAFDTLFGTLKTNEQLAEEAAIREINGELHPVDLLQG